MNRLVTATLLAGAAVVMMAAGCRKAEINENPQARVEQASMIGTSPTGMRLISPVPNGDWTLPAGDYANTRYSPLNQINAGNVKGLKVVTTLSTGVPRGHEGNPLVVNNTLYAVTPFPNFLIAVDLTQPGGALKWTYDPLDDPNAQGVACCDVVNRGASYANGKIFYATLDDNIVAVDAATGAQAWKTKIGDINNGETLTAAPIVVKDLVIDGNSGGELGVRGKVTALDINTGKVRWVAYNQGSDKDCLIGANFHPFYKKDQGADLGERTWPPDQWKLGGATVWGWISYDPETNLIYYGSGNPGVWNPDLRPGDNKWSCSIIARNADTGEAVWAYQVVPHDMWDYDEIMENVLVDMPWKGQMRKLLVHPGRTGFVFVLDRTTGELLSAEKFEPSTNWATGYDLKTGLPNVVPEKMTHQGVVVRDICPSSTGAKDFIPSALSPRTGLLYIPAHNTCMDYEGIQANYIAGTPYLGASVKMFPGPGGYQGELVAWDVANARVAWTVKDPILPVYSGVLATGGDVVFYGTMEGWLRAVDAKSGALLWQFHCGSGIVGNPMTYVGPDGKQYVAVYAGVGGWMGAVAFPSISTDDPYAGLGVVGAMKDIKKVTGPGDTLYVFGL